MIWTASGPSVAMPSRTAAREPARFTTRVLPEIPASPRDTPASTMPADKPGRAQRLGDAEQFTVEEVERRFRRDVARRDTRAAHRHHQVDAADHRGVERIADLDLVGGHHDHAVDDEPRLTEQFGDQRTAVVLLVAVSGAVIDDDDQRPAHQLPWLFHELNRISGQRQRRGHSQRPGGPGRDASLLALPRVTSTVCGLPAGSR